MGKQTAYLGIDPGVTGAMAIIHEEGQRVEDWPGDEVAASELIRSLCLEYHIRRAAIEDLGGRSSKGKDRLRQALGEQGHLEGDPGISRDPLPVGPAPGMDEGGCPPEKGRR